MADKKGLDMELMSLFLFWYIGNIAYNDFNKGAAHSADKDKTKFAMIIATAQLAVGAIYALFKWGLGVTKKPTLKQSDYIAAIPAGVCSAGAHAASVFSLAAGGVAFGQIVKSAEPAFAALVSSLFYGKKFSTKYWLSLVPVIGGVVLASLKLKDPSMAFDVLDLPGYISKNIVLDFSVGGLVGALVANLFASFKSNEAHKLGETEGLKDRFGNPSNQFAVMSIISLLASIPLAVFKEKDVMGDFFAKSIAPGTIPTWIANYTGLAPSTPFCSEVLSYTILSGMSFYLYNELSNLTLKKVDAATNSVANTAKRVFVIGWGVLMHGGEFGLLKQIGCATCIAGVYLNSVVKAADAEKAKKA
jgi:solute carrier family 35 protein E1